ncbi:tudor domain-containing protein 5 [Musca vetustissima]|uniref:tudor domain-containing protein 5 n=1 Tax=Musca vetustissima TaxID=27455 RepID=UPI002AB7506F|nr:tudor domain-containing protein 5 [Musca vetustissima]
MDSGYLNQVKAILKSLVISCPDKITIDKLNRDYREIEGQNIPYRRLGYTTLEQFLRQIPDTLVVVGSGQSALVYFVGNDKSAHIHEMIMTQKKTRPRTRSKNNATPKQCNLRQNNKACFQGRRIAQGQQLSPFQITNRNVSTSQMGGYHPQGRPPVQVPQVPMYNPVQQAINNSAMVHKYEEHVQQWKSLMQPKIYPQAPMMNWVAKEPIQNRNMTEDNNIKKDQQNEMPQVPHNGQEASDPDPTTPKTPAEVKPHPTQSLTNDSQKNPNPKEVDQKYQEHVKQLESLLGSSCRITTEPPPATRKVTFSKDIENDIKITVADKNSNESRVNLTNVNPPKPKIKLSERMERILNATAPPKKLNPIENSEIGNVEVLEAEEMKSPTKVTKKCDSVTNKFQKLLDITEEEIVNNDLDEAVPEFAATSNVFRLDLPKYTVPYGRKIEPCEIPENVDVGSCLGIFISEIHNPFRFWFHIHKENHELDCLMHQMERYYGTMTPQELRIPIACLNPGQFCAAAFNEMWHRAEIVAAPVNNKIKVSFIDYGTVCDVDICDIKYLGQCFSQLPAQALRGSLSNIKPRGLHWSHEATIHFLSLVSEKMLYAKITEIDRENSVFYMILCDTHDDEVLQINKNMVEMKYALYNEDWQETKIEKNNGHRTHHPREDFPTFAMIESGEYPTFTELLELKEKGIDYELIYDRIIFNKCAILNTYDNVPEPIRKLPFFLLTNNPFRADIVLQLTSADMKSTTCAK